MLAFVVHQSEDLLVGSTHLLIRIFSIEWIIACYITVALRVGVVQVHWITLLHVYVRESQIKLQASHLAVVLILILVLGWFILFGA